MLWRPWACCVSAIRRPIRHDKLSYFVSCIGAAYGLLIAWVRYRNTLATDGFLWSGDCFEFIFGFIARIPEEINMKRFSAYTNLLTDIFASAVRKQNCRWLWCKLQRSGEVSSSRGTNNIGVFGMLRKSLVASEFYQDDNWRMNVLGSAKYVCIRTPWSIVPARSVSFHRVFYLAPLVTRAGPS
ncbi:hypothetical protein VTP01DRAFT_924 [Rhizomucor pusillus]|uniref:uncharacterized protein n=1 Tax=Rhizomucor pusillus TaxID=4840 RepID=UPI003742AFCC